MITVFAKRITEAVKVRGIAQMPGNSSNADRTCRQSNLCERIYKSRHIMFPYAVRNRR
jgi:hypothetical protein